ncbi:hypothetical protein LPB86_03630 [Pedobacter sp. MC2016-14]|uniref:hypothetical protein n=1 Tax=Pedobacter sp. MC2016-14 TaxID=2897327 RepID=UPI001E437D8C|nr:hypothetical protein [Pedobacter sp. MC2016-14]MCD0487304.1 hypothetical protein [Pedobacter sp. MC2016-14]
MGKVNRLLIILLTGISLGGCNNAPKKNGDSTELKKLDFTAIKGIRYTEVKRRFSNGLSFDTLGFQQEPSWIVEFYSNDTIMAYSPQKKIMQPFHLLYDHGDVYNFAKEYFRFKKISKDSLVFQRLQVNNKEIAKDIRSDVNITYYADAYIKDVLHTTAEELQRPTAADTAFIKERSEVSNRNPGDIDSAFAARQPVELIPLSKAVSIEKLSSVDVLNGKTQAYDYLYPRYKIKIQNAYKDFAYEFTVIVDAQGRMYLGKFWGEIPEYHEVRKKVLQGIIKVYLENLFKIKPGTTLNMPHSSEITVLVTGKKGV